MEDQVWKIFLLQRNFITRHDYLIRYECYSHLRLLFKQALYSATIFHLLSNKNQNEKMFHYTTFLIIKSTMYLTKEKGNFKFIIQTMRVPVVGKH